MGSQACKCDRSDQHDDGNLELQTAVETRLEPHSITEIDTSILVIPNYFDSLQWAKASDPSTETGMAPGTQVFCDSWMEHFTDQEIQQLEADAIRVAGHSEDQCHKQPVLASLHGNASFQLSPEKRKMLELHMDTVAGALADEVQSAEARLLSTEPSEGSTQPSENNFLYSPKNGFQEVSGTVSISDQCGCMNAADDVRYKGDSESNSDRIVQEEKSRANQIGCQGHELQGASSPQASALVEGVGDVAMQCSQASKLHHISAWYHVGAAEEEDSDGTGSVQAMIPQSAGYDAVCHPQPVSPKRNSEKKSSRRPSHAKTRAIARRMSRSEDVLLW